MKQRIIVRSYNKRKGTRVSAHVRYLKKRLDYLAKKEGLPKPKIAFVDMKKYTDKVFGYDMKYASIPFYGDYNPKTKTIYMDRDKTNYEPGTLEHEFKHYKQHLTKPKSFVKDDVTARKIARKSYQLWSKRYDENKYEAEARKSEKGIAR